MANDSYQQSIRFPADVYSALTKFAEKQQRTITTVVIDACRRYLADTICPYCGASLDPESNFCPDCGRALSHDAIEAVKRKEQIAKNSPEYQECLEAAGIGPVVSRRKRSQ